jgi:hypothetical protein
MTTYPVHSTPTILLLRTNVKFITLEAAAVPVSKK